MDFIVGKLFVDVKESKYYIALADDATNCFLKEQLSLIFRFLDESSTIREEFESFFKMFFYGLSSQSLYKVVKEFLDSNGIICISDCRGQGYIDAGVVSGNIQGLAVHSLRINSEVLYTHCSCHRLNLAVVVLCEQQRIQNLLTYIKETSYFFDLSVPRNNCLK